MTVTGKTVAENLAEAAAFTEGQDVIMPISSPIKETGHLQILYVQPSLPRWCPGSIRPARFILAPCA